MQLAQKAGAGEIYNIANENEKTIYELAQTIKDITHSKSEITLIDAPKKRYDYEVERRYGNSDKLFRTIGYKPSTELKTGLQKILEDYNKL
jgi:nucleoside-diphosphate-sugar epimerase